MRTDFQTVNLNAHTLTYLPAIIYHIFLHGNLMLAKAPLFNLFKREGKRERESRSHMNDYTINFQPRTIEKK